MKTWSVVSLLALSAVSAAAQSSARPVQLVVTGGLTIPTGDFGDFHKLGAHADVGLLVNALGNAIRLRPELTFSRFAVKELPGGGAAGAATDLASSLLGGFGNLEFALGTGGAQPFVLGGIGAVNLKTDATTATEALSETKVSFNVGAGIRFRLGGAMGLVEARPTNVPSDNARAYFKGVKSIPVTFGLIF